MSVFSGATSGSSVPPYLMAAAALESRAFPIFAYDPSAPVPLSLDGNPQPERTWPEHELIYADAALQRVTARVPFTFVDFAAADRRLAPHFAPAADAGAANALVDVGTWLDNTGDRRESLPFVHGSDVEQLPHTLVVDDQLVRAARRSTEGWLRLRGSVPHEPSSPAVAAATVPAAALAPAAASVEPLPDAAEKATSSAEAYIETSRCTSCNECVHAERRDVRV